MGTIRPTYPLEIKIFILSVVFFLSCFLSTQIFDVALHDPHHKKEAYLGMVMVGCAVSIMVLIIWEEILFPIRIKRVKGGVLFRNHSAKLKTQILVYCLIPIIFTVIYVKYEVNVLHFIIWATVCMVPPVFEKLISGINNYHDFLKLTDTTIEYKNNALEGRFETKDVQHLTIIKDEKGGLTEKLEILFKNNDRLIIDLDEMELDGFYHYINRFIGAHYKKLLD